MFINLTSKDIQVLFRMYDRACSEEYNIAHNAYEYGTSEWEELQKGCNKNIEEYDKLIKKLYD